MKRLLVRLLALVALVALAIIAARLLLPLPDVSDRVAGHARPSDPSTTLGRAMDEGMRAHPGKSGVAALKGGHDALASRLALARQAEHSIDSQYYLLLCPTAVS